jgi:hypothetical protein
MSKLIVLTALLLHSLFVSAQEIDQDRQFENSIYFSFNEKSPFVFMGKIDTNKTGAGTGSILYPGDNALVFFAAILTHAAISGGLQHSQISKQQIEANQVLNDYESYIQKFNVRENIALSQLDVAIDNSTQKFFFLTDAESEKTTKWEMNVAPIFFMTQNHGSLILYNKVVIKENTVNTSVVETRKRTKKKPAQKKNIPDKNEKIVVVISDPIADKDFKHYWSNNDGLQFTETLKLMYRESLNLIVANKLANMSIKNTEQVTVKYVEDGVKKIERGYIISSSCKRTLFESLSGEIKSVPNLEFSTCVVSL